MSLPQFYVDDIILRALKEDINSAFWTTRSPPKCIKKTETKFRKAI